MSQSLEQAVSFPGRRPLKDQRREAFCREYTRHGDKQRAVVAAGFNCKTWEEGSTSASAMGCNLMKEPQVLERVQYLQEHRMRQADLTELNVLKELKRIAFFDIGGLYHPNGALKAVKDWPEEARRVVSAVDVEKMFSDGVQIGTTVKIKTNSKIAALEKLMEYFHMVEAPGKQDSVREGDKLQVNIYLPENPRHAKVIDVQPVAQADAPAEPASNGHGVQLPSKTNGSH
jgi:hypothetical protein